MRKSVLPVVLVVVLIALSLLYVRPGPNPQAGSSSQAADPPATPRDSDWRAAKSRWIPPALQPDQPVHEALHALHPEARTIRCAAPDIPHSAPIRSTPLDGAEDAVQYAALVGGDLFARVTAASGRTGLLVDLAHVGVLTWQDVPETGVGTCTIDPVEWVTVTGSIEGYTPTTMVRGCGPADVVKPDDNGHFQMQAALGTPCYPFAFDDTDNTFAKGPVVTMIVDGDELRLHAPSESDRLSLDQQRERIAMFVGMFSGKEPKDPFAAPLSDPSLPDSVRAVLTTWAESEDAWTELERTQLEEMAHPDADPTLYRDLWLGFH